MIRRWVIVMVGFVGIALSSMCFAKSTSSKNIAMVAIDPQSTAKCGMQISVPNIKNALDQRLVFGCTGNYENDGSASLNMDFQNNPNNRNGGEYIGFIVRNIGISDRSKLNSKFILRMENDVNIDQFSGETIRKTKKTYCSLNVSTKVTPIQGMNWHGWIAEDIHTGTLRHGCIPPKEYTSRYRCIGLLIGNDKMSAITNQFCLLRKRELSLVRGFSYDLFMEVLKTIRFNEGSDIPRNDLAPMDGAMFFRGNHPPILLGDRVMHDGTITHEFRSPSLRPE